jgi:hypothetical protein
MNKNESFNDAVTIVREKLSPDSAKIIHYSIEKGEAEASTLQRVGFGVAIRNLLAENGMLWEEVILFSVWFAILKEAIKPFIES